MSDSINECVISEESADSEWDRFVADATGGHHVQTSLWAKVKAEQGWTTARIIVRKSGIIVAGAQILIHKYPLVGKVAYAPKAPLCKVADIELVSALIERMRQIAIERRFMMLALQPPKDAAYISDLLVRNGFCLSTLELTPVATIILDLSLDKARILAQTKRQTRQNINRSIKEGITIHEGLEDGIDDFYHLYLATSRRQKFRPYSKEYFETMYRIMAPEGCFQIIFARYRDEAISALLLAPFRDTIVAKILGWSGLHKEMRPNEAVFWGAILWAKDHGYRYFDFEGIDKECAQKALDGEDLPERIRHSPDHLKYGFGGKIEIHPETFEYIPKRFNRWLIRFVKPEVAQRSIASRILDIMRKR